MLLYVKMIAMLNPCHLFSGMIDDTTKRVSEKRFGAVRYGSRIAKESLSHARPKTLSYRSLQR